MKRRIFVKSAVGVGVAGSLAGCEQLQGDSDNNDNQNQNQNDNNQNNIQSGDSSQNNTQLKQELLDKYDSGNSNHNRGMTGLNQGTSAYNAETYNLAIQQFETGLSGFEDALSDWEDAYDLALELGNSEAQSMCDNATTYAQKMIQGTEASIEAAEAAQNGNMQDANDHADTSRQILREAESISVRPSSTMRNVLDL